VGGHATADRREARPPPMLGQHTAAVLARYATGEIAATAAAGVVGSVYRRQAEHCRFCAWIFMSGTNQCQDQIRRLSDSPLELN
jgi:hypothetical protein